MIFHSFLYVYQRVNSLEKIMVDEFPVNVYLNQSMDWLIENQMEISHQNGWKIHQMEISHQNLLENPHDQSIPNNIRPWEHGFWNQDTLAVDSVGAMQMRPVELSRSSASAPGLAWGGKTLSVWFVMITNDHYPSVTIMIMMIFIWYL